jgi:hypothetical protein
MFSHQYHNTYGKALSELLKKGKAYLSWFYKYCVNFLRLLLKSTTNWIAQNNKTSFYNRSRRQKFEIKCGQSHGPSEVAKKRSVPGFLLASLCLRYSLAYKMIIFSL